MTLGTGAVSFDDIRTEFGMSGAISYADLYRGGSNIRAKAANNFATNLAAQVPASGEISIANFQGQARGFRITYGTGAAAANYQNQNAAVLFGDDYAVNYPKEIVIGSGVELGATSASEEALEVPSGGAGTITITNNGIIRGGGGCGGTGGQGSYASYSTPYWSGTYRWLSYGGANSSATGNRQVAVWGGSYVVNSYTTALSIGQYSRSSYVTVTFSDPVQWQYRITRTTTNYQSGGAGGVGGNTSGNDAGDGGVGLASSITGSSVYRGGGGAG